MAVGENIGLDGQPLTHDALGRETSAIDLGLDAFDDDALPTFVGWNRAAFAFGLRSDGKTPREVLLNF